ncbi:uncharacterized protein pre-mod(mdg4)-AD [Calliphora vicina]|uniref:uncharacterized protein pre-mod(mdg4)-AD n=1 Tax=Calliphora vicina TaxID=7373 RepID=UPI00325A5077
MNIKSTNICISNESVVNPISARYIISRRGTQLVFYKYNTYTPNSKLKPESRSRDWKCSMYHKAKCKARLVTKLTSNGDIIHVTSSVHTHEPMFPVV